MPNNKRLIAEIINGEEIIMTIDDNMLSCEFGALDRGNLTDVVNWGIYANRGSISFIDNVGYFNNQNVNSTEINSYILCFYLVDKIKKTLISTFKIENADYNDETKTVNINVVSKLLELQRENTTSSVYPFIPTSAYNLVSKINEVLPISKVSFGIDVEHFSYITIGCPYIGKDTAWNVITKICQATMSRIVETPSGELEITGSFPKREPIIVAPHNIISITKSDFVRIENPNIFYTKRKKYEGAVTENSKSSFSININIENPKIPKLLETTGITLSNVEKQEDADGTIRLYADGEVIIKTPYKLFSVELDYSTVNIRYTVFYDSDPNNPRVDTKMPNQDNLLGSPSIENEQNIVASLPRRSIYETFSGVVGNETAYKQFVFSDGTFVFPIHAFEDTETIQLFHNKNFYGENDTVDSNDLIQDISNYEHDDGSIEPLGSYIIDEVYKRYHKGIECFEIECLFNDYYYLLTGEKAGDSEDLSKRLCRYDVIVPAIIKNGEMVPLRRNEDGTPKMFRIIGISYSYDGLLKQKLYVQEERYDVD